MQRTMTMALCVLLAASLAPLGLAAPLLAETHDAPTADNVLVRLTLVETNAEGVTRQHPIEALVATGDPTRVSSGWKIPIQIGGKPDGAAQHSGLLHYQDVGLSVRLSASNKAPGKLWVRGSIEMSQVDPKEPVPGTPQVESFSHSFNVLLGEGEGRSLVSLPGPRGGTTSLEISASSDG